MFNSYVISASSPTSFAANLDLRLPSNNAFITTNAVLNSTVAQVATHTSEIGSLQTNIANNDTAVDNLTTLVNNTVGKVQYDVNSGGGHIWDVYISPDAGNNSGLHASGSHFGVVGKTSADSGIGVYGYSDAPDPTNTAPGVSAWSENGVALRAETSNSNSWGIYTTSKIYANQGVDDFTGSFFATSATDLDVGDIVNVVGDGFIIDNNNVNIEVELSSVVADRKVVGVVGSSEFQSDTGDYKIRVNISGVGVINVTEGGGNILAGYTICVAGPGDLAGLGRYHGDSYGPYTVAKALIDVTWANNPAGMYYSGSYKCLQIPCIYTIG